MVREIVCKECKERHSHYAKGFCMRCYHRLRDWKKENKARKDEQS